jgi:hypothetical protein
MTVPPTADQADGPSSAAAAEPCRLIGWPEEEATTGGGGSSDRVTAAGPVEIAAGIG